MNFQLTISDTPPVFPLLDEGEETNEIFNLKPFIEDRRRKIRKTLNNKQRK